MSGKLLQFKRFSAPIAGLRMLYLEGDPAESRVFFRLRQDDTEYYFNVDRRGTLSADYALCREPGREITQHLDADDFSPEHLRALRSAQAESRRIAREQIDAWEKFTPQERIQLKVVWAKDLVQDLECSLRETVMQQPARDRIDIFNTLLDIEEVQHRIEGLELALACF